MLSQLVRTKATPEVELYRERAFESGKKLDEGQADELWDWAGAEANRIARNWNWEEDEDEDDEDESDEDEDEDENEGKDREKTAPSAADKGKGKADVQYRGEPMRLEDVLKFLATGIEPALLSGAT
jgi:hypothetical protein